MTITRYEQITTRRTKAIPCPSCGKKVRRTRTFTNTINPFNRNDQGAIKDRSEVCADVKAEAERWERHVEFCAPCSRPPVDGAEKREGDTA